MVIISFVHERRACAFNRQAFPPKKTLDTVHIAAVSDAISNELSNIKFSYGIKIHF